MNRVGLKDYLLNHADDNDLLDCAKAWGTAWRVSGFPCSTPRSISRTTRLANP